MIALILLAILLLPTAAHAVCTNTSANTWSCPANSLSADLTQLQNANPTFQPGDTVNVTGGANIPLSAGVTITRGMWLRGPGRDAMTLGFTATHITINPNATTIANDHHIKITGFTFDGNNTSDPFIQVNGPGQSGTKPWRGLHIESNRFQRGANGSNDVIHVGAFVYGVVADNLFDLIQIPLRCFADDASQTVAWRNSAYVPFSFGSSDNLYFEDNTIGWSSAFTDNGGYGGWIESGHSGRCAVRYNTWNYANLTSTSGNEAWDIHGFQNYPGSAASDSTMVIEYYGNKLIGFNGFRWINHRGSIGLFFNNTETGTTPDIHITQYDLGCMSVVNSGGFGAPFPPPNGEVNNTYFWNLTINGAAGNAVLQSVPTGTTANLNCPPVQNGNQSPVSEPYGDFRNFNASCTAASCTTGIGRGTTAPTGTCSKGSGYWVASTPTVLSIGANDITGLNTINQAGKFYKCTAPNTWTLYYQPYQYPHPFRGAASGDTTPPSAPTNLRLVSLSQKTINVTWDASTDNTAVTGYLIEHCSGASCASFSQVGTTAALAYSDGTLLVSTPYTIRVRATDAANNLSQYSNSLTVTTPNVPFHPSLNLRRVSNPDPLKGDFVNEEDN